MRTNLNCSSCRWIGNDHEYDYYLCGYGAATPLIVRNTLPGIERGGSGSYFFCTEDAPLRLADWDENQLPSILVSRFGKCVTDRILSGTRILWSDIPRGWHRDDAQELPA
jgi:hypothetical protein